MGATEQTIMDMYLAMRSRFGHRHWWPGETKLEICLGAILTQNTNWKNVEKALANLNASTEMTVAAIAALPPEQLAEIIRPAGYYKVKAKRLGNFLRHVLASNGDDLDAFFDRPVYELREDLLGVNGIGRETADSMILYAAEKPVFVVDAYTARVFLRHHLIGIDDDYESIRALCEQSLPEDVSLWNDYHAQLVEVGKQFCRPKPRCEQCPLNAFEHDVDAGREF
jgi:endonuclease-3 related protein